ncbi:MAG: FG-GAP-like repeat-containing protein [Actinobacteria bacterium]|nr:FG-GAP-like repeat-containing protein [Actinomycetota bacterium]
MIGNTDSGIRWTTPDVVKDLNNKFFLNTGELPEPNWGTRNPAHPYDRDRNGQVDMRDWCPKWDEPKNCGGTGDSRVRGAAGTDDTDFNKNGLIDPEELIFLFSNGKDDDADGYADNISGWDTYEGDNDPFDEFQYGHGSGEARDSTAEPNNGGDAGTCPNCRIMVLRVGDSFIADVNAFAQAVLFATDTGASLIQSALGTLNNSRFAQEAVDYAYRRGVSLIASAADESAGHHNQPSELEHASVFNAIGEPQTDIATPGNVGSASGSYLQFRGCTNYGAYITAAVPANSCSSEAVGRSAGMAGLAYSTARNAVAQRKIKDYGVLDGSGGVPAGFGLSAEEIHQLVATTADDIDNTGKEEKTDAPVATERYPATPGYDPFFGYGRINASSIVRAVDAGQIPPEAYIDSPKWYAIAPTTKPIRVLGTVAARRAASYDVSVKWGVWSWRDTNTAPAYTTDGVTLSKKTGTSPYSGLVATIDPKKVQAALNAADTSAPTLGRGSTGPGVDPLTGRGDHENRQIPDKFGVIIQMTVTAKDAAGTVLKNSRGGPLAGIATKDMNLHDDPALLPGFPKDLQGDGAAAPRYADLNDDGKDELVVATSNGLIHAYEANGTELAGWPVHTTPLPSAALPTAKAYRSSEITRPIYSATLRPPAIGDLNRDGRLEVVVPDFAGRITAFDRFGKVLPGFPVRSNPAYSSPQPADRAAGFYAKHPKLVPGSYPRAGEPLPNNPDLVPELVNRRTQSNRTAWWFLSAPTLSDIDPSHAGLEIIQGGGDRHVYAWHADGTPVKGWPVLLRDPTMVGKVDPNTHEITQKAGTRVLNGAKIVTSPSVGDLDGNGIPEVLIAPNEQYDEPSDTDDAILNNPVVGQVLSGGNDRLYAVYNDGAAHGG